MREGYCVLRVTYRFEDEGGIGIEGGGGDDGEGFLRRGDELGLRDDSQTRGFGVDSRRDDTHGLDDRLHIGEVEQARILFHRLDKVNVTLGEEWIEVVGRFDLVEDGEIGQEGVTHLLRGERVKVFERDIFFELHAILVLIILIGAT